jgi:hypothetical protein
LPCAFGGPRAGVAVIDQQFATGIKLKTECVTQFLGF